MFYRYDVLFMTEPLDELTMQSIGEYKGKKLTDLGKENIDLADDEDDKIKKDEQSEETQGELPEITARILLELRLYSSIERMICHYRSRTVMNLGSVSGRCACGL